MADEKRKKSKNTDESVTEHTFMKRKDKKKKKKSRENSEEDGESLDEEIVVDSKVEDGMKKSKKKDKERVIDSEAEADDDDDDGKKKKKKDVNRKGKGKRNRDDSGDLGDEETRDKVEIRKRKTKKKKQNVDSEDEQTNKDSTKDEKKKKKQEADGNDFNSTKDAKKQRKETEPEENNKDSTKDAKKKKQSEDSEPQEKDLTSTKYAKKKSETSEADSMKDANKENKKQGEVSEADSTKDAKKIRKKKKKKQSEETNNDSTKYANKEKKKHSEVSDAQGTDLNSTNDTKKKRKKKKQSEDSEPEETNKDGNKKRKKKSDEDVTTPSSKSAKKVKFSDQVEIFPSLDEEESEQEDVATELVRGKRFTKEEDEQIRKAVSDYVENHALGEEGINMVLDCKSHPQVKGCWKEIANALPWRPYLSIYHRAHTIFESGSKGIWTKEDLELVSKYQKKHGNDWRALADAMGKNRKHVKDAWRRIRLDSKKKGHWSREEYQTLFDLVNKDLRMKAFREKHSKHGMLRDDIPWMAISDQVGSRDHVHCCAKWYDQLTSPMVKKGEWANVDDYLLVEEVAKVDAACIDDVNWDNLLENRDGDVCRKRWNQMVVHIGMPRTKTFAEQVEILAERYCADIAEDREDFDNRPFDPED